MRCCGVGSVGIASGAELCFASVARGDAGLRCFCPVLSLPGDDVAPVSALHFGGSFGVGLQGSPDGAEVHSRIHGS